MQAHIISLQIMREHNSMGSKNTNKKKAQLEQTYYFMCLMTDNR